ncbi:hypothetical protein CHGG_01150 [Chaetomium globosum CBS 148.51]|uniref:J domain-containing protein n=1 Tax=Chaetomium globosum (strain ATCC 6205 / CBS 148.51 / DSM 1962 / NBRC 6347 / NRRL 1970) TaxID=306901 RepID=Q2HF54_CHAGB|nr:uncharacterized protein CHGG_01150 [Chaetomium globosum CBS 148.51]EAQ92915.1 hypothetical protein CHGG_01150 [Chaetomium globosum CBS 148.51]
MSCRLHGCRLQGTTPRPAQIDRDTEGPAGNSGPPWLAGNRICFPTPLTKGEDSILGISESASTSQIRDAYKRAALKTHPDRLPAEHPDRAARTRQFQLVNDAYYTLNDAGRRREYDAQRKLFASSSGSADGGRRAGRAGTAGAGTGGAGGQQMPGGFDFGEEDAFGEGGIPFSWAWNFFTGGQGQGQPGQPGRQGQEEARARTEDEQFADVFEEMLREEGMAAGQEGAAGGPAGKFWSLMGGLSGGALGFIVANVPGLVARRGGGESAGRGERCEGEERVCRVSVRQELPQTDRAKLLSQLAAKVLSHAVGV